MAKTFTLTLDGREYPFFFGLASLEEFLERHGLEMDQFEDAIKNVKHMTELIHLGMLQGHEIAKKNGELNLDRKQVVQLLDRSDGAFLKAMEFIGKCMERVMGVELDMPKQSTDTEVEKKPTP